jgi:hypothetical protein
MDATTLENAITSDDSVTAVSGFARGVGMKPFSAYSVNVAEKTSTIRMIMDSPAAVGGTAAVFFPTRPLKCRPMEEMMSEVRRRTPPLFYPPAPCKKPRGGAIQFA